MTDCPRREFCVVLCLIASAPFDHAADPKPNVIFIEVDDLTASYAGPWGSKTGKTPTPDKLAKDGFVFDHAMCQGVMCGPSRNSLICGKYPHQLGMYQNGDLKKLPKDGWVFPKAMQKAGYYTAWVGKSHLKPFFAGKKGEDTFKPYFGFDHELHTLGRGLAGDDDREGGDNADNPYVKYLEKKGLLDTYKADAEAKRPRTLPDGWFSKHAEDLIAGYDGKKPLFLWMNYSVPHDPHDVPAPYHTPFADAKMPGTTKAGHKHTLFRPVTHPSLIVRAPNGKGGGVRVAQPVELLDLLPTFLEVAESGEKAPNGVSLVPLFAGKGIDKPHVFAEIEQRVAVSDGTHRLIRNVDGKQAFLFDEKADPDNLADLSAKQPDAVKKLGTAVDVWQKKTGDRLPAKSQ